MKTHVAVIVSAVTVAALPQSAAPRSLYHHHRHQHHYRYYYGYFVPHGHYRFLGYYARGSYGPYTPALPVPRYGPNPDFQSPRW